MDWSLFVQELSSPAIWAKVIMGITFDIPFIILAVWLAHKKGYQMANAIFWSLFVSPISVIVFLLSKSKKKK